MRHNFKIGDVVMRTNIVAVKGYEKEMTLNGIYTISNIDDTHILVHGSNIRWDSRNFKLIEKVNHSQLIEIL